MRVRSFLKIPCRCLSIVAAGRKPLSPAVWHLIENHQIDPDSISPTGKGGRLLKGDVLLALQNKSALPKKGSATKPTSPTATTSSSSASSSSSSSSLRRFRPYKDIPITDVRRAAAQKFGASKKSVPHSYAQILCSTERLYEALSTLKTKTKVELSVSDFVVLAAARALKEVPEVNAVCPTGEVEQLDAVNINIAMQSPSGLVTPLLANADRMGLAQIATRVRELKDKSQDGGQNQDGSFTVYDLEQFDITSFSAVISPPQAAILAVASTRKTETGVKVLSATLSLDARVGDDSVAAKWLSAFQRAIENPGV